MRLCQRRSQERGGGGGGGEEGGGGGQGAGGVRGQRGGQGRKGGSRKGGQRRAGGAVNAAVVDRKVQKRRCNAKDEVRTTLSATFQVPSPYTGLLPTPLKGKSWLHNCPFKKI